jgi:5-methylcytosine-specific restriction endonuclease McrA
VKPLAPEQYKVQFTVGGATHDKLRRAQELLRHAVPNGDPAAIFDRALTLLIEQLERKKLAAAQRPRGDSVTRSKSRYVPASVRRAVWARDDGRCAFVGAQGRCEERGFLELHHVIPYASGGTTDTANLQIRCRAHNAYEAELFFGRRGPSIVRERRPVFG